MAEKKVVAPYLIIINFHIALVIGFLSEMASVLKKLAGKKEVKEGFTRVRVRYVSCNRYFNISKARTLLVHASICSSLQLFALYLSAALNALMGSLTSSHPKLGL